jgi:hypothetical protein
MVVQVLSVPMCAECSATGETLMRPASEYPVMHVERLNIADRPEVAERYGLLSFEYDLLATHALAIDGTLADIGHPSEAVLRSWLDEAVGAEHGATADASFERSERIIVDATRAPRQLDTSAIPPAASRGSR